jgi:hypothetical protein
MPENAEVANTRVCMLEIILILIVGLVGIGGATFYYATREGATFVTAFALAVPTAIVFTGLALWAVNECELAWYLRQEVRAKLTEQERDTLRAQGLVCPTAYVFESGGKRVNAFVVDGWRGAKVYIGED